MPKSRTRHFPSTWKISRTLPNFRALIYSIHIKNPPSPCSNHHHGSRTSISLRDLKKNRSLNNISIFDRLLHSNAESRTLPTEGNFCIHSPRVEGQEVRKGEGVDRESAPNEIDFPFNTFGPCAHAWLSPLGGQWWMKKKFRSRHEFDVESTAEPCSIRFNLPPNGARLNGLPASWTSSRDTDHRGAFRSWWPGSPALVIVSTHGWLIHFSPPLSLSFFLFFPFHPLLPLER